MWKRRTKPNKQRAINTDEDDALLRLGGAFHAAEQLGEEVLIGHIVELRSRHGTRQRMIKRSKGSCEDEEDEEDGSRGPLASQQAKEEEEAAQTRKSKMREKRHLALVRSFLPFRSFVSSSASVHLFLPSSSRALVRSKVVRRLLPSSSLVPPSIKISIISNAVSLVHGTFVFHFVNNHAVCSVHECI